MKTEQIIGSETADIANRKGLVGFESPTQSRLETLLRDKYFYHVTTQIIAGKYIYFITDTNTSTVEMESDKEFNRYEDALEDALKYIMNTYICDVY